MDKHIIHIVCIGDVERVAKLYAKRKRLRFIAIKSSTKKGRVGLCVGEPREVARLLQPLLKT